MKYLAHIEGEREQTIKEHSIGTAELAAMFAKAYRYVASFAEAWIETTSDPNVCITRAVASFAEAWIETHGMDAELCW